MRINMFAKVTMTPILKNSLKVKVAPYLLSAASKIITLLAAPKIVKFPAIVLPAARAIHVTALVDEKPESCKIGIDIATNAIAEKMTSQIISGNDYANGIKQAIMEANKQILEYTIKNPDTEGMGTTVVCALVEKNNVYLASIGDSRAYVISGEEIRQVTKDHSRVQELIDAGQIKAEEAVSHPQKNIITLAVGIYSDIEVDTMKLTLADDEFLLLCCDGLTNEVDDDDIKQIVTELKEPQSACKKLVDLANEHGGKDNISVIIFG